MISWKIEFYSYWCHEFLGNSRQVTLNFSQIIHLGIPHFLEEPKIWGCATSWYVSLISLRVTLCQGLSDVNFLNQWKRWWTPKEVLQNSKSQQLRSYCSSLRVLSSCWLLFRGMVFLTVCLLSLLGLSVLLIIVAIVTQVLIIVCLFPLKHLSNLCALVLQNAVNKMP